MLDPQLRQSLLGRKPLWLQALMFVPEANRHATGWLWLLLDDMLQTALLPSQSSNARIKLAWWEEQLQQAGSSAHPALKGLHAHRPELLEQAAWQNWLPGCEQLLTQPLESGLNTCQHAWMLLELALEQRPHEPNPALLQHLVTEQGLAQHRNRIRFGLPGMQALASVRNDFWNSLAAEHPQHTEADRQIRELATQALQSPFPAGSTSVALSSLLRGWSAHFHLRQWKTSGLGAYNGLHCSPWRSLLGYWLSARRHRSST